MYEISSRDLLLGANDTYYFCHFCSSFRKNKQITISEAFSRTADKRTWGIINPGIILASAYSYFVFGQERGMLKGFPEDLNQFLGKIKVSHKNDINEGDKYSNYSQHEKVEYIKRRIRNAIAHCNYRIYITTMDRKIRKDGDLLFVFKDDDHGKKKVEFRISLPDFGNIVENCGEFVYTRLYSSK